MSTPEYQALALELQSIRLELDELKTALATGGHRATRLPRVIRLNEHIEPVGGSSDPPRSHRGKEQTVIGTLTGDDTFEKRLIQRTSHQSWLPKYAQDVTVIPIKHFDVVLPTPNRLIPVLISAITGAPFGFKGYICDVDLAGGTDADPTGFGDELPVLPASEDVTYKAGIYPIAVDQVLPGMHLFPKRDAMGASTIVGVDPLKGFFLVFPAPHVGPLALTITKTKVVTIPDDLPQELTVETKIMLDGAGRVRDVDLTLSIAAPAPP